MAMEPRRCAASRKWGASPSPRSLIRPDSPTCPPAPSPAGASILCFRLRTLPNRSFESRIWREATRSCKRRRNPEDLLAGVVEGQVTHHVLGLPGSSAATQVLLEPFEVGVVVDGHGLQVVRPVAVVLEDQQAAGDAHLLEPREELQALRVGDAVIPLAGDDEAGRLQS